MSYPDHYSIVVKFKGIPRNKESPSLGKKFIAWNKNKSNGWTKYKELTTNNPKLERLANSNIEDPDVLMKTIDSELNRIKYIAFGKVKIKDNSEKVGSRELENLIADRDDALSARKEDQDDNADKIVELEKKISKELKHKQKVDLNRELDRLKSIKESKGKTATIYSFREKILEKTRRMKNLLLLWIPFPKS